MKRNFAVLAVLALVVSPVIAEEAAVEVKPAPAAVEAPAAVVEAPAAVVAAPAVVEAMEMTLQGKISKVDVKDAQGKVTGATFVLATAVNKIDLPGDVKDELLNVDVVVTAKGVESADKKITIKEIVKIEKAAVVEAPVAAPVAPEAK